MSKSYLLALGIILILLTSCGSEDSDNNEETAKKEHFVNPEEIKRVGNGREGFFFTDLRGDTLFGGRKFWMASEFKNGYSVITEIKNGIQLRGVINYKGEEVIPIKYTEFINPNSRNGYFNFSREGGGTGFIDSTGKIVFQPIYKSSKGGIKYNQAILQNDKEKWGSLSLKGDTIIEFKYSDIGVWYDARVLVKQNNQFSYLNTEGIPINDEKYQFARDFENGLALVKKNGMIGFIDTKGKQIIECQFTDYKTIVDVVENHFADFGFEEKNHRFMLEEGYIIVKKNGKWGYINSTGETIVPIEFDDVAVLNRGSSTVGVVKNGKQGYYSIKEKTYTEKE